MPVIEFDCTYSVNELATLLKMKQQTIRDQVNAGKFPIPSFKVGRLTRFKGEKVKDFLDSRGN